MFPNTLNSDSLRFVVYCDQQAYAIKNSAIIARVIKTVVLHNRDTIVMKKDKKKDIVNK